MSAGFAPGAVLALSMVRSGAKATVDPAVLSNMAQSWTWVLLILFVALVVLVVTGSIRLSYRTMGIEPAALPAKGRVALAKHAVFFAVYLYTAVMAFMVLQP
jgi:hypothetical protein